MKYIDGIFNSNIKHQKIQLLAGENGPTFGKGKMVQLLPFVIYARTQLASLISGVKFHHDLCQLFQSRAQ